MSAVRKVAWFFYWCGVALAQWFGAFVLSFVAQVLYPARITSEAEFLRMLALTWATDIIAIFLLGWLALAIRRAPRPRRLGLRLGLAAVSAALLLLLPYLSYRISANLLSETEQGLSRVATPAVAAWAAILAFQLPGWFKPLAKPVIPAEAT